MNRSSVSVVAERAGAKLSVARGLTTIALLLAATSAQAATYTFDLRDFFTGTFAGTGSLAFQDRPVAQATSNVAGRATYNPTPFTIAATVAGKPDVLWTVGGVFINYAAVAGGPCCAPPPSDSISLIGSDGAFHAYGDLSIGTNSANALSSGDFTSANFNSILANMTGASFTIGGPPTYRYTAFNFAEVAAPVPESGEWAMMATGLAIVGATARSRRAKATREKH